MFSINISSDLSLGESLKTIHYCPTSLFFSAPNKKEGQKKREGIWILIAHTLILFENS